MKQVIFIYILFFTNLMFAQNERQIARDANNSYNKGLFVDSEVDYRKSILKNQEFEEAKFNLSDALFKQDRYDESIGLLKELVSQMCSLEKIKLRKSQLRKRSQSKKVKYRLTK